MAPILKGFEMQMKWYNNESGHLHQNSVSYKRQSFLVWTDSQLVLIDLLGKRTWDLSLSRGLSIIKIIGQQEKKFRLIFCHVLDMCALYTSVQKIFIVNPHIKKTYNVQTCSSLLQQSLSVFYNLNYQNWRAGMNAPNKTNGIIFGNP